MLERAWRLTRELHEQRLLETGQILLPLPGHMAHHARSGRPEQRADEPCGEATPETRDEL